MNDHGESASAQFVQYLNVVGFHATRLPDPWTGDYCRCQVEGDRGGSKNGWYRLVQTPAGLRGYYGTYKQQDDSNTWKCGGSTTLLPPRTAPSSQPTETLPAALQDVIDSAYRASKDHPYLRRKKVGVHGDVRQSKGALLLPMLNNAGKLVAIQRIFANGSKPFVIGSKPSGASFRLNEPSDKVFVGEGYATCASILESLLAVGDTVSHVVMAGSASNLPSVCLSIKLANINASIFVVADNDSTGLRYAYAAAEASYGQVISINDLE
jgi:phage/plasmid primase-like uncharacterized protein